MLSQRVAHGRGTAVVHQRSAEPNSPQRWSPDLVLLRGVLLDAIAGADVVQQQIRKQGQRLPIERGRRVGAGREHGDVARRAAEGGEDLLSGSNVVGDDAPWKRRKKL